MLQTGISDQPRRIPLALAYITVGNDMVQFALFWLGFVLILTRWWAMPLNPIQLYPAATPRQTTTAVVKKIDIEGGSDVGDVWAKHYTYSFKTANGVTYQASYRSNGGAYEVGALVPVKYLRDHPTISRIVDLAPAIEQTSMIITIALLSPFVITGIVLFIVGLRIGLRHFYLLQHGEMVIGMLVNKELYQAGRGESSKRAAYNGRFTYEYRTSYGESHQIKTCRPVGTAKVGTENEVYVIDVPHEAEVLVDPRRPAKAVLFRELYGHPRIDAEGRVYSAKPQVIWLYFIVPVLVFGGHWLWTIYSR
jgi:hypothetical protein